MKILFVGDIMGRPGRDMLKAHLPQIIKEENIDFTVVNGENAAGGRGITLDKADELFDAGADVLTMGNHVWDQRELMRTIDQEPRIVRPINFPPGTPGKGSYIWEGKNGLKVGVINAQGRVFLQEIDCPFRTVEKEVELIRRETPIILVDLHAEATSEKQAMGWFLDGRVSFVVGTHTHVMTNDARILPKGTAYLTDAGMTGPRDGILGMDRFAVINKFTSQLPARFTVAEGEKQFNAVIVTVNEKDGTATDIRTVQKFQA